MRTYSHRLPVWLALFGVIIAGLADIACPRITEYIDGGMDAQGTTITGKLQPSPTAAGCFVTLGGPHDGLIVQPMMRRAEDCERIKALVGKTLTIGDN